MEVGEPREQNHAIAIERAAQCWFVHWIFGSSTAPEIRTEKVAALKSVPNPILTDVL